MEEVHFRFFYDKFRELFREKAYKIKATRVSEHSDDPFEDLDNIFDIYWTPTISPEERIRIFDEILFDICVNYVSLANMDLGDYPKSSFAFLDLILNNAQKNKYLESFLLSIQFIFKDYFNFLGKGDPLLRGSEEECEPVLEITLDEQNKIEQFEAINMNLLEENKAILRVLTLEKANKIGPVEQVTYHYKGKELESVDKE